MTMNERQAFGADWITEFNLQSISMIFFNVYAYSLV